MLVNKKAIFGLLVAMVLSLGTMGGINKKEVQETNLYWLACTTFFIDTSEASDGAEFALGAMGCLMSVGYGAAAAFCFSNPVGWAVGLGVGL